MAIDTKKETVRQAGMLALKGYSCSEAIVMAVGGYALGHVDPLVIKMASGFAGGIKPERKEICGALSGGIMVIGALYGRQSVSKDNDLCQKLVNNYYKLFADFYGCVHCQDLQDKEHCDGKHRPYMMLVERSSQMLIDVISNGRG